MNRLRRYLITGLIVIVPVFLTIYVLIALFRFFDGILGRFLNVYLGFYIPGLGFLFLLLVIILTGLVANRFIGKRIFLKIERWFITLPLINKIYPTFKQIIAFILQQKEFGFKKVVLVEYPSKGIWSIGFLTNEEFQKMTQMQDKEMVSVFVPSSPGPLTGYVIFVPKEEIKFLDISVSDAIKIIISGGIFKPSESP